MDWRLFAGTLSSASLRLFFPKLLQLGTTAISCTATDQGEVLSCFKNGSGSRAQSRIHMRLRRRDSKGPVRLNAGQISPFQVARRRRAERAKSHGEVNAQNSRISKQICIDFGACSLRYRPEMFRCSGWHIRLCFIQGIHLQRVQARKKSSQPGIAHIGCHDDGAAGSRE